MDLNSYGMEKLAEARLAELRAASARAALLASLRPAGHGARAALGEALIRAGRWLLRDGAIARGQARSNRALG
jgi:hypothetical protein